MANVLKKTQSLHDRVTHYCAGCGHGIVHRLICEIIDELDIREKTIAVAPVGCAVLAYDYWNFDTTEAAHGRPPAVATGIKRMLPDRIIFTYQGDGDLAAIGTSEIIHAANRGENITVIFVNNGTYGMTGGQMAPTTLLGQKTKTTPLGRDKIREGYPLKISEMLAILDGVYYLERVSVHNPQGVRAAKKAIKKAFINQIENKGFSMVEVLAMCPTAWEMPVKDSVKWVEENVVKYYPLGVLKQNAQ
ncbi:MAG: 2-oxoglutarate oxidoreductase [Candidatus Omnitrophica bacterium]|nr:2-oxoglutarate oxidoreductase [Candidatus Omnitrophota bacterium]